MEEQILLEENNTSSDGCGCGSSLEEGRAETERVLGEPLVRTTRGGWTENVHSGHAAAVSADGELIAYAGDPNVWSFMRSTAKPVQAVPSVLGGVMEAYGLDEAALALMCASHQGEEEHIDVLERMLRQTGIEERLLVFGPTLPSNAEARGRLLRDGGGPRKLYHVCAGKHIGMLALCRLRGWPLETYMRPDHPLQEELLRTMASFADVQQEGIGRAVDGCGLPVFAMPLRRIALVYARLAAPPSEWADDALRAAAIRIAAAMNSRPALVEGSGRLASVMLGDGNVVAKSGAQGMFLFALRQERIAVALKLADGTESAWPEAACAALEQLRVGGHLVRRIREHFPPAIVNDAGETVGRREPCMRLRRP